MIVLADPPTSIAWPVPALAKAQLLILSRSASVALVILLAVKVQSSMTALFWVIVGQAAKVMPLKVVTARSCTSPAPLSTTPVKS